MTSSPCLLHPYATSHAPQQLVFIDPGAGTGANIHQKWLIALYDNMVRGRTQAVLRLLKEQRLPPGTPLTTSVLSSQEGVEVCFALPLACLMTSRTPEKVLKTLAALKAEGYTWKTTCTLEKREVPWETACALAWVTLYQRLPLARQKALPDLVQKRSIDIIPPSSPPPTLLRDQVQAFVTWQGGEPDLLTQPDHIKALLALSVYTLNPTAPAHVGMFLTSCPPSLLQEAWTTSWQPTLLPPALQLAHRVWAFCSLGHYTPVLHQDAAGTLTVPSPATVFRCWRSAWDAPSFPDEEVRAHQSALLCVMFAKLKGAPLQPVHETAYLEKYKRGSKVADGWYAVPGGRSMLRHLDRLEPLPEEALHPGCLIREWHLENEEQKKDVRRQFTQQVKCRKKHMPLPPTALKGNSGAMYPQLFATTSSGNKVLRVSPYERTSALTPPSPHAREKGAEEDVRALGGSETCVQDGPPTVRCVSAADVLMCWDRWLNTTGSERPETASLVALLKAFEEQEGAPFTFKAGKDERRWSIHGYLWARGTTKGEEASLVLSKAGYAPSSYGYAFTQETPEGQKEIQVEPVEACFLHRLNTLIKEYFGKRDNQKHQGLPQVLRESLDACLQRFEATGYTPLLDTPLDATRPLLQTALSTLHLRNTFPLYLWLKEKNVPLRGAAVLLQTLNDRLTLDTEKGGYWWKKEQDLLEITQLSMHLEQHALHDVLQENMRPVVRPTARPRL